MRETLTQIAHRLIQGEVAAVPTETVYGLAASLRFPKAIDEIFVLKKRPANNPLIIHLAAKEDLFFYSPQANDLPHLDALIQAFWPGPLTLVVPIDISSVPEKVRAGLATAAFRMPAHPLAHALIKLTGPLVMPSANLSGKPSATHPDHVELDFGPDFPVLDGGSCTQGVESTILYFDKTHWKIIRQGAIAAENFLPILGYVPTFELPSDKETPLCPGQMYRHYAPKAKLILTADFSGLSDCVIVGFSDRHYPSERVYYLGSSSDADAVARHLYDVLRQLDKDNVVQACIDVDLPNTGLFRTVLERLHKASCCS